ncbi:MAG TPA: hypothetical protein VFR34_04360 [Paracoccaceae bacterium]|nr:hypothetical protein [Paracoccaceae bacterium]
MARAAARAGRIPAPGVGLEARVPRDGLELRHAQAVDGLAIALRGRWDEAAERWERSLTRSERACLLGHVIRACEPEDAVELMAAALAGLTAGWPVPAFPGPFHSWGEALRIEAEAWVATASLRELKTYLVACFFGLPETDRLKFLAAMQRRMFGDELGRGAAEG